MPGPTAWPDPARKKPAERDTQRATGGTARSRLGAAFLLGAAGCDRPPAAGQTAPGTVAAPLRWQLVEVMRDRPSVSFSRDVTFTVPRDRSGTLSTKREDLTHSVDPSRVIKADDLAIKPRSTQVSGGQVVTFDITINNVAAPGTYRGRVPILLRSSQGSGDPQPDLLLATADLVVIVSGTTPPVSPVAGKLDLQATGSAYCHALADFFLPPRLKGNTRRIAFQNGTASDIHVSKAQLTLQGTSAEAILTASDPPTGRNEEITLTRPAVMPASGTGHLTLDLDRTRLAAGKYTGRLLLWLEGATEPLPVDLTLDLRNGPLLALLVIFLGIGAGRLATQAASVKSQLLSKIGALREELTSFPQGEVRIYLEGRLARVERRIRVGEEPDNVLTAAFGVVHNTFLLFRDIEELAVEIEKKKPTNVESLRQLLREARAAVVAEDFAGAQAKIREAWAKFLNPAASKLKDILGSLFNTGEPLRTRAAEAVNLLSAAPEPEQLDEVIGFIREHRSHLPGGESEFKALAATSRVFADTDHLLSRIRTAGPVDTSVARRVPDGRSPGRKAADGASTLLRALAGSELRTGSLFDRYGRPLLFLAFLFALSLWGLHTLYVTAGLNFGINGTYDYLALFTWGLTAEVIKKTLLDLPSLITRP
jgi:hypothetical protein